MKVTSLDGSMSVAVAAPGCGFTVTLDSHAWLFDRDGKIVGSIIERGETRHIAVSEIARCPICSAFIAR